MLPLTIVLTVFAFHAQRAYAVLHNITLSCKSPLLSYTPSRYGNPNHTWSQDISGPGWDRHSRNSIGLGSSFCYTLAIDSTVSTRFKGVAAYFFGHVFGGGSLACKIDGGPSGCYANNNNLLAWTDGLDNVEHEMSLVVTEAGGLGGVVLRRVVVTLDLGDEFNHVRKAYDPVNEEGKFNAGYITRIGSWELVNDVRPLGARRIATNSSGASLMFTPPDDTSFIILKSTVGSGHGPYQVSLTDETNGQKVVTTLDGSAEWTSHEVGYIQAVDPHHRYRFMVRNVGRDGSSWFEMTSVDWLIAEVVSGSPAISFLNIQVPGAFLDTTINLMTIAFLMGCWLVIASALITLVWLFVDKVCLPLGRAIWKRSEPIRLKVLPLMRLTSRSVRHIALSLWRRLPRRSGIAFSVNLVGETTRPDFDSIQLDTSHGAGYVSSRSRREGNVVRRSWSGPRSATSPSLQPTPYPTPPDPSLQAQRAASHEPKGKGRAASDDVDPIDIYSVLVASPVDSLVDSPLVQPPGKVNAQEQPSSRAAPRAMQCEEDAGLSLSPMMLPPNYDPGWTTPCGDDTLPIDHAPADKLGDQ